MLADGHHHVRRHEVGVLGYLGRALGFDGAELVHVDEIDLGDLVGQLALPGRKGKQERDARERSVCGSQEKIPRC